MRIFSNKSFRTSPYKPDGFDYFVLIGVVINLLVVGYICSYWLFST